MPYWETGLFEYETSCKFEFNWTLADIFNPLATSGFIFRRMLEQSAENSRFWQDSSYLSATNETLSDWAKKTPRNSAGVAHGSFAETT